MTFGVLAFNFLKEKLDNGLFFQENIWKNVPTMSRPRSAAGVAVFENDIYVAGGHDGLQIFYSVEKYNPATQTWASVPPMLEKR